jgi:hypothetical protein
MGAKASRGEILVFIDADTVPEHIAIQKVAESIQDGAVMVHLNRCCTDSHFQSGLRVANGWIAGFLGLNGQFIGVSKDAFDAVGGFDELCLPQEGCGEDVEFIRKVMRAFPNRTVIHRRTYSGTSARRQKTEGYIAPVFTQHFQSRAIRGSL